MARTLDDCELCDPLGQGVGDLSGGGDRRDRVELAHADERRTFDGQLIKNVEPAHHLEAGLIQLVVDDRASPFLLAQNPWPEEPPATGPLLRRDRRTVVAVSALDDRSHLVAAGSTELLDDPSQVEAGECGLEHQRPGMKGWRIA